MGPESPRDPEKSWERAGPERSRGPVRVWTKRAQRPGEALRKSKIRRVQRVKIRRVQRGPNERPKGLRERKGAE